MWSLTRVPLQKRGAPCEKRCRAEEQSRAEQSAARRAPRLVPASIVRMPRVSSHQRLFRHVQRRIALYGRDESARGTSSPAGFQEVTRRAGHGPECHYDRRAVREGWGRGRSARCVSNHNEMGRGRREQGRKIDGTVRGSHRALASFKEIASGRRATTWGTSPGVSRKST